VGSHLQHPAHSDTHRLTSISPEMILVTYKIDSHPERPERPGPRAGGQAAANPRVRVMAGSGNYPSSPSTSYLAGEFLTTGLLIASGVTWLAAGSAANGWVAAGLGMLLYTMIVSPRYFLTRRELPAVGMFGVLAVLTVTALA